MNRFYSITTYFRQKFGHRIQKIPFDAGATCPNRDGTLSHQGCIFCNDLGSGSGLRKDGQDIACQYDFWSKKFITKYKNPKFLAYFQSYTNTYFSPQYLQQLLTQLHNLPDIIGLALGTRPDCLEPEKIAILAEQPYDEIWIEIGLQSAHDKTLKKINRGHSVDDFERAVKLVANQKLLVCAHIIAGLPGETKTDFLRTIDFINSLPIHGIKIHNLYVCKNSTLNKMWEQNMVELQTQEIYMDWVMSALSILRPDITIHRLNGDPIKNELVAPSWAGAKGSFLHKLEQNIINNDIWQGQEYLTNIPNWFELDSQLPASLCALARIHKQTTETLRC